MTPRVKQALIEAMKAHAVWCHTSRVTAPSSLMVRLTGHPVVARNIEEQVEGAMMALAAQDLLAADVLRLEFGAGWIGVIKRRRLMLKWKESDREQRAKAMNLSGLEYATKEAQGLQFILKELTK